MRIHTSSPERVKGPPLRWHNLGPEEALKALHSGPDGLSQKDAAQRLRSYGPNELGKKGITPWPLLFLRQFASPLIYLLLAAAVIELAILKKPTDAVVILVVVFLNALIGLVQEFKAERALESLRRLAVPQAKVLREGSIDRIPARFLVPGDIVVLEAGDRIPADGRLLEARGLTVDESLLTGESVPVEKFTAALEGEATVADRGNLVYLGCPVLKGRGRAVVIATGMDTEIGKVVAQVQEVEPPPTPLQRNVAQLGRWVGILVLGFVGLLVVIGLGKGYGWEDMFILGIAAAVSAIPEGLPVMVTVVLALGMRRMAQRHALIRKLPAVETMGAVTVICADKTGTLTESEMTVRLIHLPGRWIEITGAGYRPEGQFRENGASLEPARDESLLWALRIGALCNDAVLKRKEEGFQVVGDPMEGALLVAALKAGVDLEEWHKNHPRRAELPFTSEKGYMASLNLNPDGKGIAYVKGAVDKVLAMSGRVREGGVVEEMSEEKRSALEEANLEMAARGLRVIALGYRECPASPEELCLERLHGSLTFVALVGVNDPPRPEAKEAVAACQRAGIKVVMITGDQKPTAVAIARELGFPPGESVNGLELDGMDDQELRARIERISVFARVEPLHKLRIVEALKSKGHIVAMTGDGVNDGPALRSADIGIAMGIQGTDVAREASDMVLLDDNFASIVAAVEEGRVIFRNIRRTVFFLLSTNAGELLTWVATLLTGIPLPVVAVQILWINLVTDGVCTIPLGLEPRHGHVLQEFPRSSRGGILDRALLFRIALIALFMAGGTILVFWWELSRDGLERARTVAFCLLVTFQWFNALNARSEERSLFQLGWLGNRWLLGGIAVAILLQAAVVYMPVLSRLFYTVPLGLGDWGVVALVGGSVLAAEEIRKTILHR